jgi:hypothetical protein
MGGGDTQSVMRAMLHEDRILKVRQRTRGLLEKPRIFRRAVRNMLQQARELQVLQPCPILAQNQFALVDRYTSKEELTVQLVVVLSRWGLLQFKAEDMKSLLNYLRHLWRYPQTFVSAAEEALSLVIMNFAMPNNPRSFEAYARKIVWAEYAKGAWGQSKERSSSVRKNNLSAFDLAEMEAERLKAGKRRQRMHARYLCVPELARASGVDPRRVYEAIKGGNLRAVKIGQSLCVDSETAGQFVIQADQKRKISMLKRKLSDLGKSKAAVRKWTYRLRKTGASETKIIECLRCLILRSQKIRHRKTHPNGRQGRPHAL